MTVRNGILLLLLVLSSALSAQTVTSYSCDFEDPSECAQWTLRVGDLANTCTNKWYIGAAGSFGVGSTKGLYVSSGTGADTAVCSYEAKNLSCVIMAYREVSLPQGTYTIQFDWKAMGQSSDKLYVYYVDKDTKVASNWGNTTVALPTKKMPQDTIALRGKSLWNSYRGTIKITSNEGKLMFVWFNATGTPNNPAAAIDNIEIYQGNNCDVPTNIVYDGNTASLTWSGSASTYDALVYNTNTGSVTEYAELTDRKLTLPDLTEEGMYYFYVRSNCQDGHSSPWAFISKFVWIKGARCIDYLDLTTDNSGAAKCFTGGWEEAGATGITEHLKDHAGMIYTSYDDEESLHAIQYIPGLTDARTGGQLQTIPDGEIASVRLGGLWDKTGNMTSTIEYEYQVNAGQNDLLVLQYACVLEYVDYHPEHVEPRFKLEILDSSGDPIDQCSQADFKAGFGDTQTWHQYAYSQGSYYTCDVRWCDWQQVTVSLRSYVGQKLTIRLTSYSCAQSAHFGYAYFTLNCEGGELEGIACGDYETDHFTAPEGFNYRWYKASDPQRTVLSTDRIFGIDRQDTAIYCVDLVSKLHSTCYYTLTANPNPRFPKASVLSDVQSKDCKNTVTFKNLSHVAVINRVTGVATELPDGVESMYYDFWGTGEFEYNLDPVITRQYPDSGGTYHVQCVATMSADVCTDTMDIVFTLPDLTISHKFDTLHICGAQHKDSKGQMHYAADSTYYYDLLGVVLSPYGCEQQHIRTVFFHPVYDTTYVARICDGTKYVWPADKKTYTHDTTVVYNPFTAVYHCDSIMRLKLTVDPALKVLYDDTVYSCHDSALIWVDYQILSGSIDSVYVFFPSEEQLLGFDSVYTFAVDEPVVIPMPESSSLPGNHKASIYFNGQYCSLDPIDFCVQVQYPASIVMMTDGFLAVQNAAYNGGYTFNDYQWYRNGELLDAHGSYIPVTASDVDAVYTVRLRQQGEDNYIDSCPIRFHLWSGLQTLANDVTVDVYSILGLYIGSFASTGEAIHSLSDGVYILHDIHHNAQTVVIR